MDDKKYFALDSKLDMIYQKLHETNIILAENTKSLVIHEKRTDLAEQRIESLNVRIDDIKDVENTKLSDLHEKLDEIKVNIDFYDRLFGIFWKIIIPITTAVTTLLYKLKLIKP